MRERNYTGWDFKKGELYFSPAIKRVMFVIPDSEDFSIINFFVLKSAVARMVWFNSFLRKQGKSATMVFNYADQNMGEGELRMELPNFPTMEYAKSFDGERVIEKGIETMNAQVVLEFDFEIVEEDLLAPFLERKCKSIFHCFEGERLAVNPGLLEVMTEIITPSTSALSS